MNPYLAFGLAMCAIVVLSLALTSYLAVHFNRRAKADMEAALTPLAAALDGTIDLEASEVSGRYGGHIAMGRAANAEDGPGRVFLTSLVDGAGGVAWLSTYRRPREASEPIETTWVGPEDTTGLQLRAFAETQLAGVLPGPGWSRLGYDPESGKLTLTRPMATRRDVPDGETFENGLQLLLRTAEINRELQYAAT